MGRKLKRAKRLRREALEVFTAKYGVNPWEWLDQYTKDGSPDTWDHNITYMDVLILTHRWTKNGRESIARPGDQ